MEEDPKEAEGPTASKWIPMSSDRDPTASKWIPISSNGDPTASKWIPISSNRDPTASKWIPISSNGDPNWAPISSDRDPAVTKDPPISNETPAAEWDPKVPPEGSPMEERDPKASPPEDPTAEPDPKASRWIPASSNGDRKAMKGDPKSSTAEPDPKASGCAPTPSNWAPRAAVWGPTSTNGDPTAEPNPEQHRAAEWDPAAPMEEDRDPATHAVRPAADPAPTPHGEHPEAEAGPLPAAVEAMLAAVAASPVRVRSQQQGDPELTAAERRRELRALFLRKPLVFLERFHGALRAEHLPCFAHLPPRYEVAFYCRQVRGRRQHNPESGATRWPRRPGARTRLRNRRYAALRQLIAGGEYFSEEEMRAREPLLYEHYIGQYRDAQPPPGTPPCPPQPGTPPGTAWAAALLRSVEEAAVQRRLQGQRLREGDSEEEDEDEDEAEGPHIPDAGEREVLREEFRSRMYQRFLDGEDGDFDYSQVDENPELDNLDIESRDAEERYFDEEEPAAAPQLE